MQSVKFDFGYCIRNLSIHLLCGSSVVHDLKLIWFISMAVQLTHLYFVWVFLVGLKSSSTQKSGEKTVIFAINLRIQTLSLFAESNHSARQYCTSLPKFSIS